MLIHSAIEKGAKISLEVSSYFSNITYHLREKIKFDPENRVIFGEKVDFLENESINQKSQKSFFSVFSALSNDI